MIRAGAAEDANDLTVVERRDPFVGAVLDQRFRMDRLLAAGGFGAVYRATDLRSDAEVALKVLHPKLTRDPLVASRFRREGKMLVNLRDPHTITAYEFGEAPDGTLYIVMELLHGESLYQRFRAGGPLPWRHVVHIARGVCSSLAEAHAAGIVHRDLKPANIHLESRADDPDFVKVLDFGIAKIIQGNNDREHTQLTQAGTMIGTVDYMSPEQMVGGGLTAGSDVYTLGVVIYEMIAGRTPFADAQTATAILAAVLTHTPDPLSRHADVPPALEQIVARCLEREVPNRFADISELDGALASVEAADLVRSDPAVPSSGFDPLLSVEATRIDVRFTESLQPVLDARGPRYQPADLLSAPPAVPYPAAPAAYPSAPSAAPYPAAPTAYPSATPVSHPAVPAAYPSATPVSHPAVPAPYAFGAQHAVDAQGFWPKPDGNDVRSANAPAGWQSSPQPLPGQPAGAPRPRAIAHHLRSFDMSAAATRDALVRRIIWITLLACAAIALLIASR